VPWRRTSTISGTQAWEGGVTASLCSGPNVMAVTLTADALSPTTTIATPAGTLPAIHKEPDCTAKQPPQDASPPVATPRPPTTWAPPKPRSEEIWGDEIWNKIRRSPPALPPDALSSKEASPRHQAHCLAGLEHAGTPGANQGGRHGRNREVGRLGANESKKKRKKRWGEPRRRRRRPEAGHQRRRGEEERRKGLGRLGFGGPRCRPLSSRAVARCTKGDPRGQIPLRRDGVC
jgi:hypothetical protein